MSFPARVNKANCATVGNQRLVCDSHKQSGEMLDHIVVNHSMECYQFSVWIKMMMFLMQTDSC